MNKRHRLILITNNPNRGVLAQLAGVDWILVDMEYKGKKERQFNRDTVISYHTFQDVQAMRQRITVSQLVVRINPWGEWSPAEIEGVVQCGADIIMLPFFKTSIEVALFIGQVGGRAKTCLLLETMAGISALDDILAVPGIDFFHIGLNDIHIERGTTFIFEFLADGGVDEVAAKLRAAGIPFGVGGMSRIGTLIPPAERILAEHLRLGSTGVILSRSFTFDSFTTNGDDFEKKFKDEIAKVRATEAWLATVDSAYLDLNRQQVIDDVAKVVNLEKTGRL